jgi:DnaJ-domain-containing protein 1
MIFLALGAVLLALLIWAGRKPTRVSGRLRVARALLAAMAAAAAVVCGLRGLWIASPVFLALSVYLGQSAASRSRLGAGSEKPRSSSGRLMSEHEALAILGVGAGASRPEIEAAYRRLMQRAHPDHGGSSGLAAQLNAARDRLVK